MKKRAKILLLYSTILLLLFLNACNGMGENAAETRNIDEGFIRGLEADGDRSPIERSQGQFSSESTTVPSNKFPHTKAITIQHAKYDFIVDNNQQRNPGANVNIGMSAEEIARLTPEDITRMSPQDIARLTQAQIIRLLPGDVVARLREVLPPNQGIPPQQGAAPDEGVAPPQQGAPTPPQQEVQPQRPKAPAPEQREPKQTPQPTGAGTNDIEARVIELTNAQRRQNGLPALSVDKALANVSQEKSNDMQKNNYFSHTSPTYGSPFDMMRDFGVDFTAAAENIAQGQRTADQVVQGWMNSEGHRANILGNFTHIGVGYNENGHYWTQMFIRK